MKVENVLPRDQYDLGYAPSRMGPYKQEIVSELITNANSILNISVSKPDALQVETDATGGGVVTVYIRKKGERVCIVNFKVPKGNSKSFIRLSNLPAYVRSAPDEITVNAGDAGTRVIATKLLRVIAH
jgi:hypothetical protein